MCDHRAMPATIVSFHAHPDDEAITVGGTLAHRRRRRPPRRARVRDPRRPRRGRRRRARSRRGSSANGASRKPATRPRCSAPPRVEFLPYHDSGMAGEATNDAARRVRRRPTWRRPPPPRRASLRDEHADVLTVYDERGGYGHPDHIQVHVVGRRAAALAGHAARLRGDDEQEHFLEPRRAPRRPGPRRHGAPRSRGARPRRPRGADHDLRRRHAARSTASAPRWPRTRRRSATTPSSSRCPRTAFASCSAPSGSSASTRRPPRPRLDPRRAGADLEPRPLYPRLSATIPAQARRGGSGASGPTTTARTAP